MLLYNENEKAKVAFSMNKKIKSEFTDRLFQCILSMETVEECYQLFEDLCTINEIQAIAQRMEVASMLDAKCTYVEIAERTGASTAFPTDRRRKSSVSTFAQ